MSHYPMEYPVHNLCGNIHNRTNLYEMDVEHWLRNLADMKESGWSPETTPMLQLEADARVLRKLANALDAMRANLTQPEKEPNHA